MQAKSYRRRKAAVKKKRSRVPQERRWKFLKRATERPEGVHGSRYFYSAVGKHLNSHTPACKDVAETQYFCRICRVASGNSSACSFRNDLHRSSFQNSFPVHGADAAGRRSFAGE